MTTNIFKPILFNTEMVQAILAGRKKQTRRVSNDQPLYWQVINSYPEHKCFMIVGSDYDNEIYPKYMIEDILWVRETFSEVPETAFGNKFIYKSTFDRTFSGPWKPSLFMPKEAARIFLKVTNVRCERLQDISDGDAIAEGIAFKRAQASDGHEDIINFYKDYSSKKESFSIANRSYFKYSELTGPKYSFRTLWDSINAKKHPWKSNPWVWVYDFERIEKPENFI